MLLNGLLAFFWLSLSGAGCLDPCADRTDQAFLDAAAQEEGAVRTESGMVFKELKAGFAPFFLLKKLVAFLLEDGGPSKGFLLLAFFAPGLAPVA